MLITLAPVGLLVIPPPYILMPAIMFALAAASCIVAEATPPFSVAIAFCTVVGGVISVHVKALVL